MIERYRQAGYIGNAYIVLEELLAVHLTIALVAMFLFSAQTRPLGRAPTRMRDGASRTSCPDRRTPTEHFDGCAGGMTPL